MSGYPSMRPQPSRLLAAFAAVVTLLCLSNFPASLAAQTNAAASERQIKAAYLYKFAGYVEWPDGHFQRPDSPFSIGVLGDRALSEELAEITSGRTVGNRRIHVRYVTASDSLEGLHILFIAASQNHQLDDLAAIAHARAILTVTESEGALPQGSIVNLKRSDQRIRFEISLDSASASQLKLSSRLLAVAESVQPRAR